MGNHIAKDWVYIDKAYIYIDTDGTATATDDGYLNASLLPTDANSNTEWSYLCADGSDDMTLVTTDRP